MATVDIPFIERTPVVSSNLSDVGYDPETRTLAVGFKNGSIFHFAHVPAVLHEAFIKAPSLGTFFHRAVRGKFESRKIAPLVMGHCPKCADEGLNGCVCENCGEDTYRA